MKLKKIASLALAGIMAVSMLTACGEGTGNSGSSSEPTTPVANNANVAINNELVELKDKIAFSNSDALNDAVKAYFAKNQINADDWKNRDAGELGTAATAINSTIGAKWDNEDILDTLINNTDTEKYEILVVYGFNTKMYTEASALKLVGKTIDTFDLKEDSTITNDGKEYSWTGSATVTEVKSKGGNESIWAVAVLITRDYVNA